MTGAMPDARTAKLRDIAIAVAAHFQAVQRDLPWRRTRDPYAIWISEVMLQQTRVATVIPYWERWMARFPTVRALADAPLDDVLSAWAGLGYYSRARNLWSGARTVVDKLAGALPSTAAELRSVPGIGPYTAGAIASIAYDERTPLVDGNVSRVLARVLAIEDDIKSTAGVKALWAAAGELVEALPTKTPPGQLNQGLMEIGAITCTPTSPRCLTCPLSRHCEAQRTGRQGELPVVAARKPESELPVIERVLVWIEDGGALLLGRRVPAGLFGGLWELPERAAVERMGGSVEDDPVAYHDQTLTHRRLRVQVVRGRFSSSPSLDAAGDPGYDAFTYVPIDEIGRRGVAAATTAIVGKYQDHPWSSIPKPSPSSPRGTRRSSKASATSASTSPTRTSPRPRRGRPRVSTS